jgi:hypothetical protein
MKKEDIVDTTSDLATRLTDPSQHEKIPKGFNNVTASESKG